MKNRIRLFLPFCVALLLSGVFPARAAEEQKVEWSIVKPPAARSEENALYFIGLSEQAQVVTAETTPPSPFPGGEAAFYISSPESAPRWFRMNWRPFKDNAVAEGRVEVEFQLESGNLNVTVGTNPEAWDPLQGETYSPKKGFFNIALRAGGEMRFHSSIAAGVLEEGRAHRLVISWRQAGEMLEFEFLLNDEKVHHPNGSAMLIRVPAEGRVVNTLRLTNGTAESHEGALFFGALKAKAGAE